MHQAKLHSQHQGKAQDEIVTRGIDQTAVAESELVKEDLMVLIESMPYYDQVIHSVQKMMPRRLGG